MSKIEWDVSLRKHIEEADFRGAVDNTRLLFWVGLSATTYLTTVASLAVQKENSAVNFYLRLGYEIVSENDEEFVMIKKLNC